MKFKKLNKAHMDPSKENFNLKYPDREFALVIFFKPSQKVQSSFVMQGALVLGPQWIEDPQVVTYLCKMVLK